MKKIFSLMVVATMFVLASCGGKSSAETAEADSLFVDTVAVLDEETPVTIDVNKLSDAVKQGDATQVKAVVGQVVSKIQELVDDGKVAVATAYASQVQEFIESNKEKLQNLDINTATITELVNMVKALPEKAEETAGAAANAVKADAQATKEAVKAAATQKVEEGKAKVGEKIDEAARKADEKIDEATQKAVEKTNEAIDNAADKIREALGL